MQLISVNNEYLEKGFDDKKNQILMEELKGKFTHNEAIVLYTAMKDTIYTDTPVGNNIRLLADVSDSMKFGEAMFLEVEEDKLINKLNLLSDEEAKAVIQMVYECVSNNKITIGDDGNIQTNFIELLNEKFMGDSNLE